MPAPNSSSQKILHLSPVVAGLVATSAIFTAILHVDRVQNEAHLEEVRLGSLQQLSALRASAEMAINKRVYLTLGLRAHVSANPDITPREFAAFAAALMKEEKGIGRVTLIKDNVINDVYPRAGNEKAIGLKLLEHPTQRHAALKAIQSGRSWLDGPVRLAQGGEAFIHRAPVYETPPGKEAGSGRYWGMVSILIDRQTLIEEILADKPKNLEVAICKPGPEPGACIHGDAALAERNSLSLSVTLPTGTWRLIGAPRGGWPTRSPKSAQRKFWGGLIAVLAGLLVYRLLRSNARYRQARREALAASTAKGEFLANMSHEIRTPLTAILGFAETIEVSGTENIEAISTIRRNGQHLLNVINDILDLSKLEAGKLGLECIDCSLRELLNDVYVLMRERAEQKSLRWTVEIEGRIPETVHSDPTRIRQVLLNLVDNAFKFTHEGAVRVLAGFRNDRATGPQMEFEVADTGIGMTPGQVSRLFRPFSQADSSTTRKFGGTGLGLTISRHLAEALGGGISVSSTPGSGSAFTLSMRVELPEQVEFIETLKQDAPDQETPAAASDVPAISQKILLVEDGPDNQRLISFVLKKAGADVTVAENGQLGRDLALAALAEGAPFAVVLMDMQMPVMDGYSATRELRAQGYERPIIALTANAMQEDRAKCLAAGCDDFATKPIDRNALLEMVRRYASRTEADDARPMVAAM